MKPDHEINGRYFVEGNIHSYKYTYKHLFLQDHYYPVDQSLPLGKCFVELEVYSDEDRIHKYEIKLDESGKAVVLTELPKEEATDELTESEYNINDFDALLFEGLLAPIADEEYKITWNQCIKAMQEYHRVKSEIDYDDGKILFEQIALEYAKEKGFNSYSEYLLSIHENPTKSYNQTLQISMRYAKVFKQKYFDLMKQKSEGLFTE